MKTVRAHTAPGDGLLRPFRFTLRAMLLLLTVTAIAMGYCAHLWRQKERARAAEKFLTGNFVGMSRTTVWQPPEWLSKWVDYDGFTRVDGVQIWRFPDAWMPYVADLRHVRDVHIRDGELTEAGLEHLSGLSKITDLYVEAPVGDALLENVRQCQLEELETLCLINLPVGDAMCAHLPPGVKALYLRNLPITDTALNHLAEYEHLQQVQFIHTDVSPDGADWLQAQRPDCRIRLHPAQGRKNSTGSFSYDTPFLVHPGRRF